MNDLADAAARERIRHDTDGTLFVEAGAGSGKTTALIERVTTLVLDDDITLDSIAAVTFTEKAGAELRDRLRSEFERVWRDTSAPQSRRHRAEAALDDLDAAAIGTLHSFAQRILSEHPIEAKLPPLLEVLDEVGSSVAFDERWAGLQTDLLDDDEIAEPLLLAMAAGVKLKHLRSITSLLGSDWDLIDDRILVGADDDLTMPDVAALIDEATRIADSSDGCTDPDDKLLSKLAEIREFGVLLAAAPDSETRLAVLGRLKGLKFGVGRQENWPDVKQTRDDCTELVDRAGALVQSVVDVCLRRLTRWIARRVLQAAQVRRAEGRLEFHDLLVLARDLLRRDESVRQALHERYRRVLLDEFQDTDPIQIELAVRIAGGGAASAQRWQDVAVPSGRLFVVGDPKQSIYRFRRASIPTYLEAQQHLGATVALTTNFRTVAPVLDWINEVFGRLIQEDGAGQPAYQALDQHRGQPAGGPAVSVLGATAHTGLPRAQASILREREAADVAAVVRRALAERWQVHDERAGEWRDARLGDVAVLVPARTSLPFLEDAFEAAAVAYRAEASSLVYQAGEVRDLLACARAIADTSDALSLVTALRSPLFGCGDDDLWRWKQAGGAFTIFASSDDAAEAAGPVGQALDYLRRLHNQASWLTPSEVLGAILTDRRMLEVAATSPRARDSWRRLRFVIDQARAWSEVSSGGLRGYLAWAARQGEETSRVAEAVLPETDVEAVRVMTVHAAKGLEFPIVILSGMTSQPRRQSGVQILWPTGGGYAVKVSSGVQTGDFDTVQPVDEQMDSLERLRLLYVATTRGRDHLVVSMHRAEGSKAKTGALVLADACGTTAAGAEAFSRPAFAEPPAAQLPTISPPLDFTRWFDGLQAARAASRRVAAVSASGLEGTDPSVALDSDDHLGAKGAAKGPRDIELPPWSKGRYGSAVGRAVHGVLQTVRLPDGSGLEAAVSAQCIAEGVLDYADDVAALARSALDSAVVRRAAERPHWRESYVGTTHPDGTVLEGIVDLIYREDDGSLVVVDYKTDAIPVEALPTRTAYYRPQIDAYVHALADATGGSVSGKLLFLNPSGAAVEVESSPL